VSTLAWLSALLVGAASAALAAPAAQADPGSGRYAPVVGQRHPDFVLPAIDDGRAVSLGALRGTRVLLVQFASW